MTLTANPSPWPGGSTASSQPGVRVLPLSPSRDPPLEVGNSTELHRARESDLELSMFCPQGSTGSPRPEPRTPPPHHPAKEKGEAVPTPRLCTAESLEAWSHPPAILSSHTCARPSARVCMCLCMGVRTSRFAIMSVCVYTCNCALLRAT